MIRLVIKFDKITQNLQHNNSETIPYKRIKKYLKKDIYFGNFGVENNPKEIKTLIGNKNIITTRSKTVVDPGHLKVKE